MKTLLSLVEHEPVGAYSGPLLAAMERSQGADLFTVSELTLPDASVQRWSNRPAPGLKLTYRAVASYGSVEEQIDPLAPGLSLPGMSIGLVDDAGAWNAITHKFGARLRGSPIDVWVGARGVDTPDWYLYFHGVLAAWPQTAPALYSLSLRVDDQKLRAKALRAVVGPGLWPGADLTALGAHLPYVYGSHDSVGLGIGGMLPTLRVDAVGDRFLVSVGRVSNVPRVYGADRLLISSGYSITKVLDGEGRRCTLVDFDAAQVGPIYVDADGLTDTPDGTGTLIEKPGAILRHFLDAAVYGSWLDEAAWPSGAAPVDAALFDQADRVADRKGQKVAVRLGGKAEAPSGAEIAEAMAASLGLRLYWTQQGLLGVSRIDHEPYRLYAARPHVRHHQVASLAEQQETERLHNHFSVDYLLSEAEGDYLAHLSVRDLSAGAAVNESLQLPWGPSKV